MSETKVKILDTAERLFGEEGYRAVSLRGITAAAGVNLAAIHYYFGSKEELLDELVMRKAAPVNEARLARLQALKEAAGAGSVGVEELLAAFLAPAFQAAERSPEFAKLMGRLHAEGIMPAVARRHFGPIGELFFQEMLRSLPELTGEEMAWRLHFTIVAMAHALAASPIEPFGRLECATSGPNPAVPASAELVRRLVAFLSGGFRAPAPPAEKVEVK